jgi:DNA-binding CsgD family transcriptional regulator
VLSCRAAESEARLSYAALGDLFDFELPDLPAPQKRALDAALLRAEVEGAPPDQRAVSVASLGVLRALAASGPVIVAIDDVQWLDVPSARVLAFVVRRLEDVPIRILAALRLGSGGDPLGLGQTGPAPSLHRVPIGPLREEAMTRLLRARTGGDLVHPVLLRLHRISGGNPLFALEIARALTGQGIRPAPGEPLPVPGDLQQLLAVRLAALPSSAADGLLVVAAAARPTEDLVVAAAARRDRAPAGLRRAEAAGILERADGRIGFTHPLLGSTVYAAATPHARRRVHRRLADLVVDLEERARHLALAASGPDPHVAHVLEEAGRHARGGGALDAAAELLELARKLTPPKDGAGLLRCSVEAAGYHFDAGDATRATALLEAAIASASPGIGRSRIRLHQASISWLDLPRVQGLCEQALREAGEDAGIRTTAHEHLAWVGIYRGDLAFAAEHASASRAVGAADHLHRIPDLSRAPAALGGPCRTPPRRSSVSSRSWRSWTNSDPPSPHHPVPAGRDRGLVLPRKAGCGRGAPRSSGAAGTNPRSAVGHRQRRAMPGAAHRGPGRAAGGQLGAGAGPGGAPAGAAALRAGPDATGEGRGGTQSQAEASRPLHPGAGARAVSDSRCAVVGAAGARRPGPSRWRSLPSSGLAPTEQRIAQLVVEGKKNREVADAMFISVKTVEANLSRIFHKLGVRSRTELAHRIADTSGQQTTPRFPPIPHRSTGP